MTSDASPSNLAPKFRFVTVQNPVESRGQAIQHLARSHAIKHSLRVKRREARERQENFHLVTPQHFNKPLSTCQRKAHLPAPAAEIAVEKLDPFDCLASDGSRLQRFLGHKAARQAGEPVFSISSDASFHSFGAAFHIRLDDPALLNALMHTLAFAVNGNTVDAECLEYKSKAIKYLNDKISRSEGVVTDVTITTIILLAGVESRLGLRSHVQIHMNGVQQLLQLCDSENVCLGDSTRRSVFWQDLNSAVITGSERVFSHSTFPGLQWKRDPRLGSLYMLPPGFMELSALLNKETIALLEDIHALQVMGDSLDFSYDDPASILQLDNQQAWAESRLYDYRQALSQSDYVLDCCLIAAYLCTYVMFTDMWGGSLIPEHCSSQLLRRLQQKQLDNQLTGNKGLLAWLLCIGGAFAPRGVIRSEYVVLLNGTYNEHLGPLATAWSSVEGHLKLFIWSQRVFQDRCRTFWEESCSF